ncbi:MAG: DUF4132 domain-containing protein [Kineosporiaceae bacterium]
MGELTTEGGARHRAASPEEPFLGDAFGARALQALRDTYGDRWFVDGDPRGVHRLLLDQLGRHQPASDARHLVDRRLIPALLDAVQDVAGDLRGGDPARAEAALVVLAAVSISCGAGPQGSGAARCAPVARAALTHVTAARTAGGATPSAALASHLLRVRHAVANRELRALIDGALDVPAGREPGGPAGGWPTDLPDGAVPDLGLDAEGRAQLPVGEYHARLQLTGDAHGARLAVSWWLPSGGLVERVPDTVAREHAAELARLTRTAQQAKTIAAAQQRRLERLLADDPMITGTTWSRHHLAHPLVGLHARTLLWQLRCGEDAPWISGLPEQRRGGWGLRDPDGAWVAVSGRDQLRFWHPARVEAAELDRWRRLTWDEERYQSFPQIWRDAYRASASRLGGDPIGEAADRWLSLPRALALLRHRGWQVSRAGDGITATWSNAAGSPSAGGLRAELRADLVQVEAEGEPRPFLRLGSLSWRRQDRTEWRRVDRCEVPPIAFSEVMRDLVALVAAGSRTRPDDPEAPLDAPGWLRRLVVERLLARDAIPAAVIEGPHLVVRGGSRAWQLHLSTGAVREREGGRLGVLVHQPRPLGIFLPFEERGLLHRLVATARLLATDPTMPE